MLTINLFINVFRQNTQLILNGCQWRNKLFIEPVQLNSLRTGFDPGSLAWEVGSLTRKLKAEAASVSR